MPGKEPPLLHDPTAGIECHRPDDRFIPLRSRDLAAALADDADRFGAAPQPILTLTRGVEDIVYQELTAFERTLEDDYAAFNPDRDTEPQTDAACARTPQGYRDLNTRLDYLLVKANFVQLSETQLRSAVKTANSFGLRVRLRPERLAHLGVWVRGQTRTRRLARTWRHPWRGQERELLVYRRLAIVTRLKGEPYVNLKLFKEIPTADIEALLPHADVQMTWFDRLRLLGGGAGVVGSTGLKIAKILGAIIFWSRLLWIVLFGAAVLTYRAITGYRYACTLRDSQRTRHLYYQNLDNNAGVIHTLLSMIAQEEVKEAVLAYCFCHAADGSITSAADLRSRIDSYLAGRWGITASFDVQDAINTLARLGLWADQARFRVVGIEEAHRRLRDHAREERTIGYHQGMAMACSSGETNQPSSEISDSILQISNLKSASRDG